MAAIPCNLGSVVDVAWSGFAMVVAFVCLVFVIFPLLIFHVNVRIGTAQAVT